MAAIVGVGAVGAVGDGLDYRLLLMLQSATNYRNQCGGWLTLEWWLLGQCA